jgi:hypothetical protein
MLDLSRLDLEEIAEALSDQAGFDHRWLINRRTGAVVLSTSDTGMDDEDPDGDPDLVGIEPLPPSVWYRDMADFAELLSDESAARRLARALRGKGAFRRFGDELHQEYPQLLPAWRAFRDARARGHAVGWLAESALVDDDAARRFHEQHPDPDVP